MSFLYHSFLSCCLVAKLCPALFATLWTVARQAPLSIGFPRQEYWSWLSFPSERILPIYRLNPFLLLGRQFFTNEPPAKLPLKVEWCKYSIFLKKKEKYMCSKTKIIHLSYEILCYRKGIQMLMHMKTQLIKMSICFYK